jgi:hypothetical protein
VNPGEVVANVGKGFITHVVISESACQYVTGSQPHLSIEAKSGRKAIEGGGAFEDDYTGYCSRHKEEKERRVGGGCVMFCMSCIESNRGRTVVE